MKNIHIGIMGILLCLCLSLTVAGAEESKGPRLVVKEKSFDAGEINEGQDLEHEFIVSNGGDSVLKIEQVKPG